MLLDDGSGFFVLMSALATNNEVEDQGRQERPQQRENKEK
jgi:hypothetical protein